MFTPLLAVDFWEIAPFLVLVVLWGLQAINQFIAKSCEAAKQQRGPRPAKNPAGAEAQRDEVEKFLRSPADESDLVCVVCRSVDDFDRLVGLARQMVGSL